MNKKLAWIVAFVLLLLLAFGAYLSYLKYHNKGLLTSNVDMENAKRMVGDIESRKSEEERLATVSIYNGTVKLGLSAKLIQRLRENGKISVGTAENAQKRDYPRTFVVDVSGQKSKIAESIAQDLGAPLVDIMPHGEATPSADILVILGEDFR